MARLLLTSSQVSVFITGTIIFLCTLALFLSGYVIQQRTVRDLREAIRPRAPRVTPKAHLPDRFKARITELKDGSLSIKESEAEEEKRAQQIIIVQQTTRESLEAEQQAVEEREKAERAKATRTTGGATKKQLEILQGIKSQVADKSWGVENPDPLLKSKVPITAAERRKMIKDEIQRLSGSTNKYVYYQRRLW